MSAKENDVLWSPSLLRKNTSSMSSYKNWLEQKLELDFKTYNDLHKWTVENTGDFWFTLFEYFPIFYEGSPFITHTTESFKEYGWFPGIKLNFAKNLIERGENDSVALVSLLENGKRTEITYKNLRASVAGFSQAIKGTIGQKDVVAAYMPNLPETVMAMLGSAVLGGAFTSTSSDFGIEGVIDRFGQSRPKVLVAANGYEYNGKYFDNLEKIQEVCRQVESIERVFMVSYPGTTLDEKQLKKISEVRKNLSVENFPKPKFDTALEYVSVDFSSPLYVMYSSGTTGKPKCIVHSVGGTLLQHIKEIGLHSNMNNEKGLFFFTTCGWMMWNWLVSVLFFKGCIYLYEGSPGYPSMKGYLEKLAKEEIHILGTSPKFLRALEDSGYNLDVDFPHLETILSTGAPLLPEQFDFIYKKIKNDVQVSSICGGTDIIGCFMLGNPMLEVRRGEIQCLGLGMDVACFDESGKEVFDREGELVCKKSFPSRPIYFLDDPDNKKINQAYFEKYEGVWHHGDFITITKDKTIKVFGRSDATLNPGGVRIGTSEIYRQTEGLSFLQDSLCVGRPIDGDVEVVLFVKLVSGEKLDDEKIALIKKRIRQNTTPRHVPAHIWAVSDIPYTRSGKKMELAVTRLLQGKELTNIEAVANPECLAEFKKYV